MKNDFGHEIRTGEYSRQSLSLLNLSIYNALMTLDKIALRFRRIPIMCKLDRRNVNYEKESKFVYSGHTDGKLKR